VGYSSAISYILFAICLAWSAVIIKVIGIRGSHE
jgi:hypothetical protein